LLTYSTLQVDTLRFERDAGVQADTLLARSVASMPDSGVSVTTASSSAAAAVGGRAVADPSRGTSPLTEGGESRLSSGLGAAAVGADWEDEDDEEGEHDVAGKDHRADDRRRTFRDLFRQLAELGRRMDELQTGLQQSDDASAEEADLVSEPNEEDIIFLPLITRLRPAPHFCPCGNVFPRSPPMERARANR